MKTDRLAKMYDRLTAEERASLILAAEKRRDEIERQRLEASAPPLSPAPNPRPAEVDEFGRPIISPEFAAAMERRALARRMRGETSYNGVSQDGRQQPSARPQLPPG
jgi:hypothetical protein